MYDNLRDADFRLRNTHVVYDKQWWLVRHVYHDDAVDGNPLTLELRRPGSIERPKLDDPKLSLRNLPLGYFNLDGKPVYVMRKPVRAYRQGIRRDNVTIVGEDYELLAHYIVRKPAKLRDGNKIINRDYAVIKNRLYYRGRYVGAYLDGKCLLNNGNTFLKESLELSLARG